MYFAVCGVVRRWRIWLREGWMVLANLDNDVLSTKAQRKGHDPWGVCPVDWIPAQLFTGCVTMDDLVSLFKPHFPI